MSVTHDMFVAILPETTWPDDLPHGSNMHAQLLGHDNHASGLGGEHGEDSLENYITHLV